MERNEYIVAVQAMNQIIQLNGDKKLFNDEEIENIKMSFILAKRKFIEDSRYLINEANMLSDNFKKQKLLKIDKLEKSLCRNDKKRNFEHIVESDFKVINRIKKKDTISGESLYDITRQIDTLIESISLLNYAIIVYLEEQVNRINNKKISE